MSEAFGALKYSWLTSGQETGNSNALVEYKAAKSAKYPQFLAIVIT